MRTVRARLTRRGVGDGQITRERRRWLRSAARRTAHLRWTPQLLEALLDELYVDDDYFDLLGGRRIPKTRYPQAVALALLTRHAWQADDFADTASKLGLNARRPAGQQRVRSR